MDNMREMNETLVKYMVESTRQAVEFSQKAWTDYVELSKTRSEEHTSELQSH